MSTHALVDRAMVLNLSIGIWQGYRLDKEASAKVTSDAGAAADAARVNKHLVPKDSLAKIVTAQNTVRAHFYANTLPWRDNGDRLMTRALFLKFIPKHEELVAEFKAEVEKFLTEGYPSAIEKAEFRMGEMFKREDYPPVEALRHRFYIGLDYEALTTSNDFRVQIDQEHVDKVKANMEAAAEKRIQRAMGDVWARIAEVVCNFAERMGDPKAIFRDSTVKNIAELMELIPGLNVLDDPNIEAVRKLVVDKLVGVDPNDIRKDPAYRAELAGEAKAVLDRMKGFMNAFGTGAA